MSAPSTNPPKDSYPIGEHIIPPPRPSSPATAEYHLNHVMVRIKDPQKSLEFYCDCMGMHVVFLFNAGPRTIYYLGPRDVHLSAIGTATGLLELYHIPADSSTPYVSGNEYAGPGVEFGHVGVALDRVREFGYEVVKPLGEAEVKHMGLPGEVVEGGLGAVAEGYKEVFRQLAFVKDPD